MSRPVYDMLKYWLQEHKFFKMTGSKGANGTKPVPDGHLSKSNSGSIGYEYVSFRKLGVPYFGVLIIRILLFRVLY